MYLMYNHIESLGFFLPSGNVPSVYLWDKMISQILCKMSINVCTANVWLLHEYPVICNLDRKWQMCLKIPNIWTMSCYRCFYGYKINSLPIDLNWYWSVNKILLKFDYNLINFDLSFILIIRLINIKKKISKY